MDLIMKTAKYITANYGSSDYAEQIEVFSHYLAFVLFEKEETIKILLTFTVQKI